MVGIQTRVYKEVHIGAPSTVQRNLWFPHIYWGTKDWVAAYRGIDDGRFDASLNSCVDVTPIAKKPNKPADSRIEAGNRTTAPVQR